MIKKIFTTGILSLGLFFANFAFAVPSVPIVEPLQPVTQEFEDFTANVNTEASLEEDTTIIPEEESGSETSPGQEIENGQTTNPSALAPTETGEPVSQYWILLFVGLAGLLGAAIWYYIRFFRKPRNLG